MRQAIAHTLDRKAIIDGASGGYGVPIGSHFSPANAAYVDLTGTYPHDIAKAKALLKEAGLENGFKATIKLPPVGYARDGGQIIASQLREVGIELEIIPVLNKIDLPAADPDRYAAEIAHIVGCDPDDVLRVSGKTGVGVSELLDRVIERVPAPVGDPDAPARAMIFDSVYDTYRGVVTYVRVVDGRIVPREKIAMMSTGATHELLEVGIVSPEPKPTQGLGVGEVGYLITGVKAAPYTHLTLPTIYTV